MAEQLKTAEQLTLVAATTNRHKILEIAEIAGSFGYHVISRAEAGVPDFEIIEDGADFEENSLIKARVIFDRLGGLAATVSDDSGLEVDALSGAPGVYSARFADVTQFAQQIDGTSHARLAQEGETKTKPDWLQATAADVTQFAPGVSSQDLANNAKLLRLLADVPSEQRTARFVSVITCLRPGKEPIVCRGEVEGHIAFEETGEAGFGYDPLFIPVGYNVSFGLFSPEDKNAISHRGRALKLLAEKLAADPA